MKQNSLILLSPQSQVSHRISEILGATFSVLQLRPQDIKTVPNLDESIVMISPGVDPEALKIFDSLPTAPMLKIRLQSAMCKKQKIPGWVCWDYEAPVQQWVTRLEAQYRRLSQAKDLEADKNLRSLLANDGEASCMYEILKLWKSRTCSENVLWIPDSNMLILGDQRKLSLDPDIQSLEPRTELQQKALFNEFAGSFAQQGSRSLHFQCHSSAPIGWIRTNVDQGLIVFEKPLRWNPERIIHIMEGLSQIFQLVQQFRELRKQTVTDDLTGLYNHRHLFPCLEYEIERTAKLQSQFSILFIDVDRFKQVNDKFGHLVGSELLSQLGGLMRRKTRGTDLSFRYGGDEYLIILRGAGGPDAAIVGERLRKSVSDTEFNVGGETFRLTLSIGVATYPENATTSEEIIRIADEAMYSGKRKSRNVVQRAA
jgi:diguanylate cyclase (GGDEF)-like protein